MSHIQTASVARENSLFLHHDITLEGNEKGFDRSENSGLPLSVGCALYIKGRPVPKRGIRVQNKALPVVLFLPVTPVQHVALGATYSVGRRSAVLPRRRMTGPLGLRIFLTSALLSSENRLTRLKPKANGTFRTLGE